MVTLKKDLKNMQRNIISMKLVPRSAKLVTRSAKLVPRSKFSPIKMLLAFPLFIILVFIIVIADWNYDKYSDLRKRFKGYRNVLPEPFEIKKHKISLIMVHLILVKQLFKKLLWFV